MAPSDTNTTQVADMDIHTPHEFGDSAGIHRHHLKGQRLRVGVGHADSNELPLVVGPLKRVFRVDVLGVCHFAVGGDRWHGRKWHVDRAVVAPQRDSHAVRAVFEFCFREEGQPCRHHVLTAWAYQAGLVHSEMRGGVA